MSFLHRRLDPRIQAVIKGAPFGNKNAVGPHNMSGGKSGGSERQVAGGVGGDSDSGDDVPHMPSDKDMEGMPPEKQNDFYGEAAKAQTKAIAKVGLGLVKDMGFAAHPNWFDGTTVLAKGDKVKEVLGKFKKEGWGRVKEGKSNDWYVHPTKNIAASVERITRGTGAGSTAVSFMDGDYHREFVNKIEGFASVFKGVV